MRKATGPRGNGHLDAGIGSGYVRALPRRTALLVLSSG